MWATITAVLLILGHGNVFSQGLEYPLKCWETLPCQHTSTGSICSLVDNNGSCEIECKVEYEIPDDGKYQTIITFNIREEIPDTSNETTVNISLGLQNLTKMYLKDHDGLLVNLEFDQTVAVGTALVSRKCFKTNITIEFVVCTCAISLTDKTRARSVFQYKLTEEKFWNFQSPVQPGWFKTFYASSVRRLSFAGEKLKLLRNTSFQKVTFLGNYWSEGDPPLLNDMAFLEKLNLSKNRLTELHKDSFTGMPKLEHLNLSDNMLTVIPPMIERVPTLITLDVSLNLLTKFTLSLKVLSKLQLLETLNLSKSGILSISGKLPPLPNLNKLLLNGCALFILKDYEFTNVPALEILDLSDNILAKIEESTFHSLGHLKTLLLSQNSLVEWPTLFSSSLKTLDLSRNYLSSLKNLGYTGTTVQYLNISNNNISHWEDTKIFLHSSSSRTHNKLPPPPQHISLTLQHNVINNLESNISSIYSLSHHKSEVPYTIKRITSPAQKIMNVSLKQYYDDSSMDDNDHSKHRHNLNNAPANHDNILKNTYEFSSYIISEDIPWVNAIDLSSNFMTCLSEAMGKSLHGVKVVDLGGNPFDCSDCRMPQFQQWLNRTTTRVKNLRKPHVHLKCASPFALLNVPVIEVEFDEELCLDKRKALWITLGVIITLILCALLIVTSILYRFRSQAMYMLHLYNIRRRAMDFSTARYDNCAFDAFICYSSKDRRFVLKRLTPFLENAPERYKLCLHERDFPLGSRIVDNIIGSIEHSRKTVMVLSENFVNSKWCKWELEMANHKMFNDDEHFLVLIQLEELNRGTLPLHLKFFMDTRTCLQWRKEDQDEEMHRRLKRALGESIFQRTSEEAPRLSVLMGDD